MMRLMQWIRVRKAAWLSSDRPAGIVVGVNEATRIFASRSVELFASCPAVVALSELAGERTRCSIGVECYEEYAWVSHTLYNLGRLGGHL
jgi:hypothetical protein